MSRTLFRTRASALVLAISLGMATIIGGIAANDTDASDASEEVALEYGVWKIADRVYVVWEGKLYFMGNG